MKQPEKNENLGTLKGETVKSCSVDRDLGRRKGGWESEMGKSSDFRDFKIKNKITIFVLWVI